MRARKFEMKPTPHAPSKHHPNTTFKKWVGDRTDLGLVKGETYTWTEFGAAVGIVASSMRGRVRGAKEVSDCHMWKAGDRKPRAEWGVATITRCETDADKLSQKYLRMSL